MKKLLSVTAAVLICLLASLCAGGAAEEAQIGMNVLLNGEFGIPVTFTVSEPYFTSLAQFGYGRLADLNRLIQHLSVHVNTDGDYSETTLLIDNDPLFSLTEKETDGHLMTVYSFRPDTVYDTEPSEPESELLTFLEAYFFPLNRTADDLPGVFGRFPEAFPDLVKNEDTSVSYKGYGKGVRKATLRFSADYVRENFPQALASLADTEECRQSIQKTLFSGAQKIVLVYDRDGSILRISYNGCLGKSEETLRRVSVSWRCLRAQNRMKDEITFKSPAVRGYDRENWTYSRELDCSGGDQNILNWDLQLERKSGDEKSRIRYSGDVSESGETLSGKIVFNRKQDGNESRITVIPEMKKENPDEYEGTIEITNNSGKIILAGTKARIRISPYENTRERPALSMDGRKARSEEYPEEELQTRMEQSIIRKLMTLPPEDLEFLSRDIPEDIWSLLIKSLF